MLNQLFRFNSSSELIFGNDSLFQLSGILEKEGFSKILIISDPGIVKAGIAEKVEKEVEKTKVEWKLFSDVEPNPSVETVEKAYDVLKKINADAIVVVGGGSAIDVSKAVGVLATNDGKITDYEGVDKFKHPVIPTIVIPTTAGSGSEVTAFAVITDTKRKYKLTVGGRNLISRYTIADPKLTLSMPASITASTGLDALVHAIESYTSLMTYPLAEVIALEAIKIISENLRQAVYNGDNLEARTNMLYASILAGMAFSNTRLGNVHAMSHPVSAMFGVAHGVANSILLPHIMEFNILANPKKFARIAEAMGENVENLSLMEGALQSIEAVKSLAKDIHIPANLKEAGVEEDAIKDMAKDAFLSGNILVNPRKTTVDDLIDLYLKAMS